MNLLITSTHFSLTPAIKEHAQAKFSKIAGDFECISCDIKFSKDHEEFVSDLHFHQKAGKTIHISKKHSDLYQSFDLALNVLHEKLTADKAQHLHHRRRAA